MNETSPEIYFQLTPVWQGVAVLCAVLLTVGFWSYRRAGKLSSARRVLLWGLRVGSVALVLFLLADPHRIDRKAFDETLAREISHARETAQPLCLLIGDIDHFKKFNDTFGHRTGDQVLRLVASCLNNGTRESDTVARYGGEEFGVILPSTTTKDAEQIANKIREAVQSRELVKRSTGESLGRVTMSLGVGSFRPSDESSSLIERADACLYDAKRNGRNQVRSELSTAPDSRAVAG